MQWTFVWCSFKSVYLYSMKKQLEPIKSQISWWNELNTTNSTIDWKLVYRNNYYCTFEVKLRYFQLKLNNRALVTNLQLHGFGVIDSNKCTFCDSFPESVLHLFCTCQFVVEFWNDFVSWASFYFKRRIQLSNFNKIFGFEFYESQRITMLLNCFLLNAQFTI